MGKTVPGISLVMPQAIRSVAMSNKIISDNNCLCLEQFSVGFVANLTELAM